MKDLEQLYKTFETGIRTAVKPKQYLDELALNSQNLQIGYNSGQFHHGKPKEFKDHCESLGILKKSNAVLNKNSKSAYTVFDSKGLIFPLKDIDGNIVNYFALRFNLDSPKEEYLNGNGIYPQYPDFNSKKLFIVPNVIDAASLLQSGVLKKDEAVIALHSGKLLEQHKHAILSIEGLEKIIIIKR